MARNAVQFQRGLSEAEFDRLYGTEEQCRAVVIAARWPEGFCCPVCGGRSHCEVKTRDLFQCTQCRRQTSPIAGTIFASTKLPLRTWFRAMYHLTQSKQGISSIELGRRLGVRQTTAWMLKHKLQQVMLERDARKRLTGRIEIDDAYLGGERSGGKRGRGAPGKTPFVAAVETTPEGKPVRLKLRRVAGFTGLAISRFALRSLDPSCTVVSDGLACFSHVTDAGCAHQAIQWTNLCPDPGVQMGQHRTREHQIRHRRHLPCDQQQACAPIPRRVRVSVQSPIRPRQHDPPTRMGRRTNAANAIPPPEIG